MRPTVLSPEEQKKRILSAEAAMNNLAERIDIFNKNFAEFERLVGELNVLQSRLAITPDVLKKFYENNSNISDRLEQISNTFLRLERDIASIQKMSAEISVQFGKLAEIKEQINRVNDSISHVSEKIEEQPNIENLFKYFNGKSEENFQQFRENLLSISSVQKHTSESIDLLNNEITSIKELSLDFKYKMDKIEDVHNQLNQMKDSITRVKEQIDQNPDVEKFFSQVNMKMNILNHNLKETMELTTSIIYIITIFFVIGTLSSFFFAYFT
jgi:chromosome segregation ATPase